MKTIIAYLLTAAEIALVIFVVISGKPEKTAEMAHNTVQITAPTVKPDAESEAESQSEDESEELISKTEKTFFDIYAENGFLVSEWDSYLHHITLVDVGENLTSQKRLLISHREIDELGLEQFETIMFVEHIGGDVVVYDCKNSLF